MLRVKKKKNFNLEQKKDALGLGVAMLYQKYVNLLKADWSSLCQPRIKRAPEHISPVAQVTVAKKKKPE